MVKEATKRAVAIDHLFFPHLFGAIISFADGSSLLQLRTTCRSVKEECDRRLLAHATVETSLHSNMTGTDGKVLRFGAHAAPNVGLLDVKFGTEDLPRTITGEVIKLVDHLDRLSTARYFFDTTYCRPLEITFRQPQPNSAPDWMAKDYFSRVVMFFHDGPVYSFDDFRPSHPVSRVVLNLFTRMGDYGYPHRYLTAALEVVLVVRDVDYPVEGLAWLIDAVHCDELEHLDLITIVGAPHPSIKMELVEALDDLIDMSEDCYGKARYDCETTEEVVDALTYLTMEEFERTSPHFGIETDPDYRLSPVEIDALVRGDEMRLKALGLTTWWYVLLYRTMTDNYRSDT